VGKLAKARAAQGLKFRNGKYLTTKEAEEFDKRVQEE
jgi:hypothetical protein